MKHDVQYWIEKWKKSKNFRVEKDRLKPKSYLFSSFPRTNIYGFQDGNIRPMIVGDFLSRYERMVGYNVLFPIGYDSLCLSSFLENKKHSNMINDDISMIFHNQLLRMGVGIDSQKEIDMRHPQYVSALQHAFIDFYERSYLCYDKIQVYQDKKGKKIFDVYFNQDSLVPNIIKAFYLDISSVQEKVIHKIKELGISIEVKNKLFKMMVPQKNISLPFYISNGTQLVVTLNEPQYMGGITFICLHPNFVDFPLYTTAEESAAIESYLSSEQDEDFGVFSGTFAVNPLTGKKIPIFISAYFEEDVHLGNPFVNANDRKLAEEEGLSIVDVIQNGVYIESDFLNGLPADQGKEKLISTFVEADMAKQNTFYERTKILVSSLDQFGALIPFLVDGDGTLNSLKKHLPFLISSKFRPILDETIDVSGTPITGSMNHVFSSGMLPFLALLYDDIGASISIFSKEALELYNHWNGISYAAISETELFETLFFPLCVIAILEKEAKCELPVFAQKITLIHATYDTNYQKMERKNNNLFEIDRLLNEYQGDAMRLYFLNADIDKDFIFSEEELESDKNLIKGIETFFHNAFVENNNALDYSLFELHKFCNELLNERKISQYVDEVLHFYKTVLWKEKITSKQALTFLKMLYPIIPFLAEDIYNDIFNGRYLLSDDGWGY